MSRKTKRFVFDVNVLVSALLLADSVPGKAFRVALAQGAILISESVFKELSTVLGREKFSRYLSWDERQRFLAALLLQSTLIETHPTISVCRDPGDNHLLDLAVQGRADCIITGDQDLLVLHPYRKVLILTPAQFIDSFAP